MSVFAKWTRIIILALLTVTLISCETADKSSGGDKDGPQVAGLDDEEKQDLENRKKKIGGSYGQLRKLLDAKRYKELQAEAGKILSRNPSDLRALASLGLYHMKRGQYGAARIFFERALEKHPDESGLYNNIGVIQIRDGNLQAALVSFKKAYDIESSNPNVLANLGSIYVKYMDYVEAEPMVEDAYGYLSDNVIVANNYAIVLRTQGQYEEAAKIYEKALRKDARNITTNLNYAILLVEYMKKYQKARQIVNKLEFLNSNDRYVVAKTQELQRKVQAAK